MRARRPRAGRRRAAPPRAPTAHTRAAVRTAAPPATPPAAASHTTSHKSNRSHDSKAVDSQPPACLGVIIHPSTHQSIHASINPAVLCKFHGHNTHSHSYPIGTATIRLTPLLSG
eukprot:363465-Chlamydomonas_euryale.AAC.3